MVNTAVSSLFSESAQGARSLMPTESKVRDFVLKNYLFTAEQTALKSEDSFMKSGIMDSTGILEMIMFLHDEFGVDVTDDEMVPENLDSVNNVVAFVTKKLSAN
jgi:acyl carrier protein